MSKVIVDPETKARLENLDKELKVYDESGAKLGAFVPEPQNLAEIYEWARNAVTDEELEAARRDPRPRLTTEELLARIHARFPEDE
jgi:hypothetical protein